jgi:hypothetical protein
MFSKQISEWLDKTGNEGGLPDRCVPSLIGLFEDEDKYVIYFSGSTECHLNDDYYDIHRKINIFIREFPPQETVSDFEVK